ncbi:TIR domain-containing protein [Fibrella forsythiae]|uniref:TIR domain-containing protein n=1 Tax=Fibrella forsythiae TaxID=2817061 RepID=A0ABS3JS98_9BACT|nr:TIR domain-containing protein [Fibrella forsythiae]MBO0952893.1 TIR domain-containing protein [Fibrella forsythiae]
MENKLKVFVSYNSKDLQIVESIVRQIESQGLELFFDKKSLNLGDIIIDTLEKALKTANCFLVFIGKDMDGPWQNIEVKIALHSCVNDKTKKIIPILLPEATDDFLPSFLNSFHGKKMKSVFDFSTIDEIIKQLSKSKLTPIYEVTNGQTEDKSGKPLGFKAHTEKIIELLVGESIYQSKFVAIRELIQNAVDACERRAGMPSGEIHNIEITVSYDNSSIEISDNGEGMDLNLLRENFVAIGKSINEEVTDENIRKKLIGKFGIGFISTFMIAKSIEISTQYSQKEQINFTITSTSEMFVYHDYSTVKRLNGFIGTTIKVNIKDELIKSSDFDIIKYLKSYCRHVPYLKVKILKPKSTTIVKLDNNDWNTYKTVISKQFIHKNFILCLGISQANIDLICSNYGFLINNNVENIIPDHFPKFIGGEINFEPNAVKLNIARNDIINGDTVDIDSIKKFINKSVREIIISFYRMNNKNKDAKKTLEIFCYII